MVEKTTLSVCIPTYELHGRAIEMLIRNFDMLLKQTWKDFEIVISDNSENDDIKNFCKRPEYVSLNIKYFKNPRKGASANTNEAIKAASGKLIKILYMDDFLSAEDSLSDIVNNFKGNWLITACAHDRGNGKIKNPHFPSYNERLYLGENTIGAPSVLTIRNQDPLLFDENLIWLLDCDYYKRLYDRYGDPSILNKVNVIIGLGKYQATHHINFWKKRSERNYMKRKYMVV